MAEDAAPPMDLSKLEELLKGSEDGETPSLKEMLDMIENAEIDDELKSSFKALLGGGMPSFMGGYGTGMLLGVILFFFIFTILLFFGYKLYKSIKEKELRREEKKKLKQMKKKK